MFGKRCTLCGGKLDSNNICMECGLDNNKSEQNYQINRSGCDDLPLTHVHRETEKEQRRRYPEPQTEGAGRRQKHSQYQGQTFQRRSYHSQEDLIRKRKKKYLWWVVILVIVVVVSGAVKALSDIESESGLTDTDMSWDPYEYVTSQLSDEGESVEYDLPSGRYMVGVHIPSGTYAAEPKDEFDAIQVWDEKNNISLYEYEGKEGEESYLDDLRLYPGAIIEISTESPMKLTSDNAQSTDMAGMGNPLTEPVEVTDGQTLEAGVDFEVGTYDITVLTGEGSVEIAIKDEAGEVYAEKYLGMGSEYSDGMEYKNFIFPEGSTVFCEGEDMAIRLTPSEKIISEDYFQDCIAFY